MSGANFSPLIVVRVGSFADLHARFAKQVMAQERKKELHLLSSNQLAIVLRLVCKMITSSHHQISGPRERTEGLNSIPESKQ